MSNQVISSRCRGVRSEDPTRFETLTFIPLVGDSVDEPGYRVFDQGCVDLVHITEVDSSGSVPMLRIHNDQAQRLLLIDGQELIGSKQNRIANATILVPAGIKMTLPVSCVEQGRWGYRPAPPPTDRPDPDPSRPRQPGRPAPARESVPGHAAYRSLRSRKAESVHHSLSLDRSFSSDQCEVWDEIATMQSSLEAPSPTGAMSDSYARSADRLEEIRRDLEWPDGSVGVAVFYGDRFMGLDLFDRESTFRTFADLLVSSYSLDWLLWKVRNPEPRRDEADQDIDSILDRLAGSTWDRRPSPGEGMDCRLLESNIVASSLVWEERSVVHLQAFARSDDARSRSRADARRHGDASPDTFREHRARRAARRIESTEGEVQEPRS